MSLKWIKLHTHLHTLNSDGKDSLLDMAQVIKEKGVQAFFLTDHNTMAGFSEIQEASKKTGVKIIKGIEYTTFNGHILSILSPYYRWETLNQDSFNLLADFIHEQGGLVGIAHPRQLGDPLCTGGKFEYIDVDFSRVDFVEVWHRVKSENNEWKKNEDFWKSINEKENSIPFVYGGDFHRTEQVKDSNAFNWVLIDETLEFEEAIKKAVKNGKIVMSKGPCINIELCCDTETYTIGETANINKELIYNMKIKIEANSFDNTIGIRLMDSETNSRIFTYEGEKEIIIEFQLPSKIRWIRAEIFNEETDEILAICNPIFFKFS